jgi:hypothetical protein
LVCAREAALVTLAPYALAAALERAVDGGDAVAEQVGDLLSRPVEDVAQHERHPLLGWQQLHGGDEGEPDPLALLHCLLGPRRLRRQVVQETVRIGLEVGVDRRAGAPRPLLEHP